MSGVIIGGEVVLREVSVSLSLLFKTGESEGSKVGESGERESGGRREREWRKKEEKK